VGAGITFTGRMEAGGFQRLAKGLMDRALPRIENAAELTVTDAQDAILDNIDADFGARQGKARSEPLADRARYPGQVDVRPTGVTIRFKVDGSKEFKAKFGALNYGSGSHEIPTGTDKRGRSFGGNTEAGFRSASTVTHPGTTGKRFFERGIDQALRFFRNRL
jgi:hypothetical protein